MPHASSTSLVLLIAGSLALSGCGAEDQVLNPDDESRTDAGQRDAGGSGGGGDDNGGDGTTATNGGNTDGTGNNGSSSGDGGITPVVEDPACDMNGIWIARQVTESKAGSFGSQFANNWYYFELKQEGRDVTVVDHFDCGIRVNSALALVTLSPATRRALIAHNSQVGRKGQMYKDGATCAFKMERFWSVRGADEARFVPSPRNTTESSDEIEAKNHLPTKDNLDGAEDWENDGAMGLAWQVLNGRRNTVQRDWTEWFTDATHTIAPELSWSKDLEVRATFDSQDNVIAVTSSILDQASEPVDSAKHRMTFRFLGRSSADAPASFVDGTKEARCDAIESALAAQKKL